jgi:hypothetical protein
VELAHIEPWSKTREHTFDNMIALCPTCHTRFDQGHIDRKSMRMYKANLTIVNSRYGDLERRVIEAFARNPSATAVDLPGSLVVLLMYLLQDGLLMSAKMEGRISAVSGGSAVELTPTRYLLTPKGREFVTRWANAAGELE